jgi:PAS domain S-box-containing protein
LDNFPAAWLSAPESGYTPPIVGSNDLGPGEEREAGGPAAFPDPGFVATANRVPVLLWACRDDRCDAWCNEAWTTFTGLSCEDEEGEGWATAVHPEDLERCLDVFRDASARGDGFILEYRLRRHDGEYRWMVDNGVPWHSRDGRFLGYAGVCVDVHENRTELEEFRRRERQQAIVADLGRFALEGEDDDELLDRAVKLLADGLGVPLAAAMRVTPEGDAFDVTAGAGWDAALLGSSRFATGGSLAAFALATDRPVVTSDVASDPRFEGGEGLRAHGVVSAVCTVIRTPGGADGVLGAYSTEARTFSDDDVHFLRSLANLLGASFARRQVEDELRARELEARLAIQAGRMGSWRWTPATGEVAWSPEMEAAYGLAPGSFAGTFDAFIERVHPDDREESLRLLEERTAAGEDFSFEHRALFADGSVGWFQGRGSPVRDADGEITSWFGIGIDITDKRITENALREANDRLQETVARLDTLLANAPLGFAFYDRDARFVGLNQPLAEINGLDVDAHLGRRVTEVLPDVGPTVEAMLQAVLDSGAPVSDIEISGQTPAQPGVERHWLASYYPVAGPDEEIAGLGAIVVEITEHKRQERVARLSGAVSELLAATPDLTTLLERAASIMVPELADSCGIYLLPRTGVARRFAVAHVDAEMAELLETADARWPLDIERMLRMSPDLRAGRPVHARHVGPELRALFTRGEEQAQIAERLDVRSSIVAPLHVADDVVGLLFLDYTGASGRVYQDADVELAELLAERLVGVLERAYLTAEAARARGRLNLLAAISELLTVGLDTRARLDAVTDVVLPTFGDACVAYLFANDHLQPVTCKVVGEGTDGRLIAGPDVPAANVHGPGAVATAFRTREPVLIRDVPDDLGEPARLLGVRSMLVVPLLSQAEPIGVLVFGYSRSQRRYAREDLALAREIAARVAPAVEDAMQFERELATAEALQRSLLPDQLPVLQDADLATRYVPGGVGLKVGGDWYDAVPLRDGRVMLVIGDVVGHGVRAAASMGKLRNVLQYSALDGLEPAQVLTRLNAYFCALSDADMATLIVAEYDPAGQRILYANAGHPPAMLRLPDGTVEALDDGRSMPLCASDQAQYQQAERDLPAGSTLVLYTDGLIERRGESLDVGLERLTKKLHAAPAAVEDVADALLRDFLADDAPADDVALLCVRVRGPEEALRLRLRATARELALMRRATGEWLERVGATDEEVHEITVAVNEVAANAVEHAYGLVDADFVVEGDRVGDEVELAVRDFGSWRMRKGTPDRGRGLKLARALMDEVDVQPGSEGTIVRLRRRIGQVEAG